MEYKFKSWWRTSGKSRAPRGGCPPAARLSLGPPAWWMSAAGRGPGSSGGSCATALFLALMPAIQGSQKIGLGNSLKVIARDSGNSRWFLRAAPNAAGDVSSAVHFQDFHYFSCLFLAGARAGVFMSFHCLLFFFFKPIPLFLWERMKLAPQAPLPHCRVQGNWPL